MPSAALSGEPQRFRVPSDGCQLMVRSYVPTKDAYPRAGVVLVHGLLSSADAFDVPGLETISLARALQGAGIAVASYDQRGAGESTTDGWMFGMREHSTVDLPAVLAACRERLGFERIVFVAHSLGGTIWLRCLRAMAGRAGSRQPAVVGGAVVASPAIFSREHAPWSDIARRGRPFIDAIDRDRDRRVTREEFVAAQIALYWPWAKLLFHPAALRAAIRAGGASSFVAGLLRRSPAPTLIYHRDDFDNSMFKRVLKSKTIDTGSQALLIELLDEILAGPPPGPAPPPVSLDVLAIGSSRDGLVPLPAVRVFSEQFTTARLIVTEDEFHEPSSHVGYLFKAGLRERVFAEIVSCVRRQLSV